MTAPREEKSGGGGEPRDARAGRRPSPEDVSPPEDGSPPEEPPARPRARDDLDAYPVAAELVLYRDDPQTAYSLNRSARSIWELCDGSRTIEGIAEELARRLGCADDPDAVERIRADVRSAVADFERHGLLERLTAAR